MKDDTISRAAALDAMETWDKFGCDPDGKLVRYDDDKHYIPYVHYEDMVHAIKHLPSAQPGWIPTSEKLPERYDNYLITTDDEDVDIGTFHPEFKHWSICDADGFMWMDGVLAWCELPTPYREGGQDGKN